MIIKSRHKRFDLAERHLSALRSEYGKRYNVQIAARRNAAGEKSPRGTFYSFKIKKNEKKKNRIYLCSVRYISHDARKNQKRDFNADIVVIAKDMRKPRTKAEEDKISIIISRVAAEKLDRKEFLADFIGYDVTISTPDSEQHSEISFGELTTKPESAELREYVKY